MDRIKNTLEDSSIDAFQERFNGSVVVDGLEPRIVFHGTRKRFNKFEYDYTCSRTDDGAGRLGFYFSESLDVARYFTDSDDEIIVEANLSIKNPVRLTADEFEADYADMDKLKAERQRARWQSDGYDGIMIEAGGGMIDHNAVVWVAFESSQIQIKPALELARSSTKRFGTP